MAVSQRIKFRCTSCEKPLGIGRKKIGATVACPKCKTKLVVPEKSIEDSVADSDDNPFSEFEVFDDEFGEPDLVYGDAEVAKPAALKLNDRLSVPRKIVYFQGALLGIVAVFFFMLGLIIGSSTAPKSENNQNESNVTGTILIKNGDKFVPDEGAVVFLLPSGKRPDQRFDSVELQPGRTFTGNNPEVPLLREFGGNVCTANRSGNFQMIVDSGNEYILVVVSRNGKRNDEVANQFYSDVGYYFSSVEQLVEDRICFYKRIRPTRVNLRLGEITLSD